MGVRGLRVLVTGATAGIGLELVRVLGREGARLIVHGRAPERVEAVRAAIVAEGGAATGLVADLASLAQARRLADAVASDGGIDVLISNAGVGFGADRARREVSRDGLELRMAVNYLAPALIAERLLAARAVRRAVVLVASAGQLPIDLDDPWSERAYDGVTAYRRSKLALVTFGFELAAAHPEVAVVSLHPGTFLDTGMVRDAGIAPQGTALDGARAIAAVTERALAGETGRYYDRTRPAHALREAYDEATRRRLAELTTRVLAPFAA